MRAKSVEVRRRQAVGIKELPDELGALGGLQPDRGLPGKHHFAQSLCIKLRIAIDVALCGLQPTIRLLCCRSNDSVMVTPFSKPLQPSVDVDPRGDLVGFDVVDPDR